MASPRPWLIRHSLKVVSLLIAIAILYYLFSHFTLRELIDTLIAVDSRLFALFVCTSLTTSILRVLRYRLLLSVSGFRPRFSLLFLATLVRNMCSDLLPARMGLLIEVYLLSSRLGVKLASALSSFSVVFILDVVSAAPLLLLVLAIGSSEFQMSPGTVALAALALIGAGVISILALPKIVSTLAFFSQKLPGLRLKNRLRKLFEATAKDLRALQASGVYGKAVCLSVLIRFGKYIALYLLLLALVLPKGALLTHPAKLFLTIIAGEFAASLPISGVGAFGVYEGAMALSFRLLGYPADLAALIAVAHHLVSQLYGYSLGLIALLVLVLTNSTRTTPR